ncbi:CUB domain-containing protein 2 [Folsomia candida]|uniref:CUB domain-containing protein 2 n=1 Tax=Folsomia candida TaxID=158441 RepID=A0A226E1A9_FOLCA|nr:CUB domain-containing protein 2 [Folsomia candida]
MDYFQFSSACFLLCVFLPLPAVHGKCPQFIALSGVSQSGNITSPGWPSPYPPDAICAYKLQGEAWQGVKITFYYFDLEPPYSAGCLNDYLELNTVDTKGQRTFRGRYCGKHAPAPILVLHPVVELVFRSNHAAHHNGFAASYEFVDESNVQAPGLNGTSPCGNVIQGIGGLIISPGYPRGYAAGLDCLWLIRAQYNHVVYLRIQRLEFQGSTEEGQKCEVQETGRKCKKYSPSSHAPYGVFTAVGRSFSHLAFLAETLPIIYMHVPSSPFHSKSGDISTYDIILIPFTSRSSSTFTFYYCLHKQSIMILQISEETVESRHNVGSQPVHISSENRKEFGIQERQTK